MKKLVMNISRVKAIYPWLMEMQHALIAIVVVIIALLFCLRPDTPEPTIRLTGLVLQLLGIGTVIWGISETRALFGHPSITSKVKSWLKAFPLLRRDIKLSGGSGSYSFASSNARGYVTSGAGPNASIENRVEALEKNIKLLHERISGTEKEMDEEFRKTVEAIKAEEHKRQQEDSEIREKLEATGTGGVHISAIGAVWLFFGVTLSTAGLEIAAFLKSF